MNGFLTQFSRLLRSDDHSYGNITMHLQGVTYLLRNPKQIQRIIIRETRYGKRYQNREVWLKWQEYDQYIAHLMHSTKQAQTRPLSISRNKTIAKMITAAGGHGLNILDIGCGPAIISQHIYDLGNNVTCADLPAITPLAHKHPHLHVIATDAECTAFADKSFNVIVATELLKHLWYPEKFLAEAHRILAPSGYVIVEVPEGKEGLRWDAHCQYFTLESLEKLAQNFNFRVFTWERLKPDVGVPTPSLIMMIKKSSALFLKKTPN